MTIPVIFYLQGDWFGANDLIPGFHLALTAYFIVATLLSGWFVYIHYKEDRQQKIAVHAPGSAMQL